MYVTIIRYVYDTIIKYVYVTIINGLMMTLVIEKCALACIDKMEQCVDAGQAVTTVYHVCTMRHP